MNLIIRRLSLAGLLALPAACATYPQQYYDSGSGYYAPESYSSGYGVIERNYYSTYAYPTPVYRTETYHHHHDDHGHYDDHDHRYPDRRYQDTRRFSAPSGTAYRRPDSHEHGTNDYYNWNAQAAKRYDNRIYEGNRNHDHRDEGWQGRPDEPNAHGQWQRQQNMERQAAKRENKRVADRLPENQSGGWQHPHQDAPDEGRQRRPDEPNAHGQWRRQQNKEWQADRRQNNGFGDQSSSPAGAGWQAAVPAPGDDRRGKRSRQFSE